MKNSRLLIDLRLEKYNLISVNSAYNFYNPKRKNKRQPFVTDLAQKENIRVQIIDQYKGKPLKINYMKVDINASSNSDIDNKSKTIFDASENIIITNDRFIEKILLRRAKQNKVCYSNKDSKITIEFTKNTFNNSVNNHWQASKVTLKSKAKTFKKDIKTLSAFYKKNKKYISKKRIIIVINTTLKSTQDLDNIFKLILDSFTGIIYEDDRQIDFIFATKETNNKIKNNLRVRIWEKL